MKMSEEEMKIEPGNVGYEKYDKDVEELMKVIDTYCEDYPTLNDGGSLLEFLIFAINKKLDKMV